MIRHSDKGFAGKTETFEFARGDDRERRLARTDAMTDRV
jgi:hypothetical protein